MSEEGVICIHDIRDLALQRLEGEDASMPALLADEYRTLEKACAGSSTTGFAACRGK